MSTGTHRSARVIVARILLVTAVLALLWATALVIFGGIDFTLTGHRFRTHEPLRPLGVAALALIVFVPLYGAQRAYDWWWAATRRMKDGPLAVGLSLFIFIVGAAYSSTTASGSDSYGYVSEAGLWLKGDLRIAQPWTSQVPWPDKAWTFSPLGYRPIDVDSDQSDLVPTCSAGLPLLMAGATYLGGHRAAFWIVPASGALLVFMTYLLGCRLGSSRAGLIGAWFVATSPAFLYVLMVPMTDVPAAAAWAVAIYCVLGASIGSAFAGGLAAGLAILIRPNLFPLAGVLALWFVMKRRGGSLALFSSGAALGVAITALINQRMYGSPFVTGYGNLGPMFGLANILPNVRHYAGWLVSVQTPLVLAGVAAVAVPLRRLWPEARDRSVFAVIGLFVLVLWLEYRRVPSIRHLDVPAISPALVAVHHDWNGERRARAGEKGASGSGADGRGTSHRPRIVRVPIGRQSRRLQSLAKRARLGARGATRSRRDGAQQRDFQHVAQRQRPLLRRPDDAAVRHPEPGLARSQRVVARGPRRASVPAGQRLGGAAVSRAVSVAASTDSIERGANVRLSRCRPDLPV